MLLNLFKKKFYFILILGLSFNYSSLAKQIDDKNYNNNLQIISGSNGKIIDTFKVKIVSDNKSREKGLMFVENLPEKYGLLFIFNRERVATMWMKNTLIPLDMLFIDKNNKIVRIARSTKPLSEDIISSRYKVKSVLELNGNISKKKGIRIGDIIKIIN